MYDASAFEKFNLAFIYKIIYVILSNKAAGENVRGILNALTKFLKKELPTN